MQDIAYASCGASPMTSSIPTLVNYTLTMAMMEEASRALDWALATREDEAIFAGLGLATGASRVIHYEGTTAVQDLPTSDIPTSEDNTTWEEFPDD